MINLKNVKKFIEFARGTSKTFTVREQALKEFNSGKCCAIITNNPNIYIAHDKQFRKIVSFEDTKSTSKTIDVWKLATILEIFKKSDSAFGWKELPEFSKYDFVYVDADCYEQIIWQLLDNIEGMKEHVNAIKNFLTHVNNHVENIERIEEKIA